MKIAIIGGGNMGSAYARCFLANGLTSRGDLIIVEQREQRRDELSAEYGCRTQAQPDEAAAAAEALLLAETGKAGLARLSMNVPAPFSRAWTRRHVAPQLSPSP